MDKASRERLRRELHRLVLADSDMRQASVAAAYLAEQGRNMNGLAERVLWTGFVVTYARPYVGSNRLGAVTGKLARPEESSLRGLHATLLKRRNDLFAPNDETYLREPIDIYAYLGIGAGRFVEQCTPMDPDVLPDIQRLAESQRSGSSSESKRSPGDSV
jgi:hypothetical protein